MPPAQSLQWLLPIVHSDRPFSASDFDFRLVGREMALRKEDLGWLVLRSRAWRIDFKYELPIAQIETLLGDFPMHNRRIRPDICSSSSVHVLVIIAIDQGLGRVRR